MGSAFDLPQVPARPKEGNPDGPLQWLLLRRGVADLYRRCELSQKANETYLEAMAEVDAPETWDRWRRR